MKKQLIILATLLFLGTAAYSQSSSIILDGGWASAAPDDSDNSLNGYKVGGQYEYLFGYNPWAVGLAIHYLGFTEEESGLLTTKYRSWPVSFYGKYLIGKDKFQGYLKGVAGMQFSGAKAESQSGGSIKQTDFGLSIGTGAGVNYHISEKVFLNVDYELLYLSNAFYTNALTNSVTLGLGYKIK